MKPQKLSCRDCRFFQIEDDKPGFDDGSATGTCRRHPPVFLPRVAKQAAGDHPNPFDSDYTRELLGSRDFMAWGFPVVATTIDCWCGEFQPTEPEDDQ